MQPVQYVQGRALVPKYAMRSIGYILITALSGVLGMEELVG